MTDARTEVLTNLRAALGRGPLDAAAQAHLDARIATPMTHPRPPVEADLIARFSERFEARSGTIERLAARADIPAAVERFRAAHGLEPRAAVGRALADLTWPADWQLHHGCAGSDETLAVSAAFAAIAETGTLMLIASPDGPTTHNFVPDNHIVVLDIALILRHIEDAWARLRARPGDMAGNVAGGMPRAVNLISGPSRTADIEQTIQLGAHGPRRLHLLLW